MCFVLYLGTEKPVEWPGWNAEARDVHVGPLSEHDAPIRAHFTKPVVQYIGSTSGCGCDFPYASLQDGGWVTIEPDVEDAAQIAIESHNRSRLLQLLQSTGEPSLELYGVWDGDFELSPSARVKISVDDLAQDGFWIREQCFYLVEMGGG